MAKKPTENRMIVYGMLTEFRKMQQEGKNVKAGDLLKDVLSKYDYLPEQDKAFMKRLFEGCIERRLTLDYVISQYANTKNGKIKPAVKDILRMAIYQILYMDAVPDAAAVNEAILIAENKGLSSLKNFINGVLRNVSRNKENISWPEKETEPVNYLSVVYSFPVWLAGLFHKRFGLETAEKIFGRMNEPAGLVVRILAETDVDELLSLWKKQEISYRKHPYSDRAYILDGVNGLDKVPGFNEGMFTVQDISSQLSVQCLGLEQGDTVLDLCASPGGKSMLAAELVSAKGKVISRDLTEQKMVRIRENMERLGIDNVYPQVQDATTLREEDKEAFDAVIADLPCSGLGVMGRKNDIRYRLDREDLRTLAMLQRDILENAVTYIKPGGRLLYSTCTISKEENEDNRRYLIEELHMTPVSIKEKLPGDLMAETASEGYLQLLPGMHDCDGFFISLYEKK